MLNTGIMSSNSNEWFTPQYIVDYLEKRYGKIILDPCASVHTNIGLINYTIDDDGLSKEWDEDVVFVNPPYGSVIKHWIAKAQEQSVKHKNTVILLIPARTDTSYWHNHIFPHYSELLFIKGRIKFETDKKIGESAPFPSCFVVFSKENLRRVDAIDLKEIR